MEDSSSPVKDILTFLTDGKKVVDLDKVNCKAIIKNGSDFQLKVFAFIVEDFPLIMKIMWQAS